MPTMNAKPAQGNQDSLPESLHDRYGLVMDRIARAAAKSGRKPGDIILVAVTKFAAPEQIRELLQIGHRDFGENRVQVLAQHAAIVEEFLSRRRILASSRVPAGEPPDLLFAGGTPPLSPAVPGEVVRWHMIGHLQRNKARKVIDFVRLIHSVDSLRLAEELQNIAVRRDRVIEVLLQANCSGEASKFGCPLPAAIPLAEQIQTMFNIRLRGVMTMAPESANPEEARASFARCRELFEDMCARGFNEDGTFNILSMGMSGDFEVAISEGANIVRVGTAIFGARPPGGEHPEQPEEGEPTD